MARHPGVLHLIFLDVCSHLNVEMQPFVRIGRTYFVLKEDVRLGSTTNCCVTEGSIEVTSPPLFVKENLSVFCIIVASYIFDKYDITDGNQF